MTLQYRKLTISLFLTLVFSNSLNAKESAKSVHYEQVFANLALHCIHQEYPNVIKHSFHNVDDVKPPSQLYPAFYGCLDWHSSVHGHWLLVRMLNQASDKVDSKLIIKKLSESFTPENLQGELRTYSRKNNGSFERPYGIAWYLQLMTELRQAEFAEAKQWVDLLAPLETKIIEALNDWLPKLAYPIRTGEHSQTAFAFGLILDWSREVQNEKFEQLLTQKILQFYLADKQCPLAYEPSGHDFLSPCLAEADLMRRVLSKKEYSQWLSDFFPQLTTGQSDWITPATVSDKSDGKLAHLDGLNLSRAWMLQGIISALDANDPRISILEESLLAHKKAGLDSVFGDMHYMGSHWLGSFATYLETERGIVP